MEIEGMKRAFEVLKKKGIEINAFISDRHRGIGKWVRKNMLETRHFCVACCKMYATTSVSFNDALINDFAFRKKVEALAKTKECEIVGKWIKSIVNHIYWCAASTPDGDSNMVKCKWISLDNHLHNVHEGNSSSFPTCLHGPLPKPRRKLWLSPRNQMRKLYKQIRKRRL